MTQATARPSERQVKGQKELVQRALSSVGDKEKHQKLDALRLFFFNQDTTVFVFKGV